MFVSENNVVLKWYMGFLLFFWFINLASENVGLGLLSLRILIDMRMNTIREETLEDILLCKPEQQQQQKSKEAKKELTVQKTSLCSSNLKPKSIQFTALLFGELPRKAGVEVWTVHLYLWPVIMHLTFPVTKR